MVNRGFTLVELLIYTSIFAIVSVVLTSIFVIFLKVDIRETASAEISSQANFILQKIQNYISTAGFLVVNDDSNDENDGTLASPHNKLVIKDREERGDQTIANDSKSPVIIYRDGDFVKVQQGQGDAGFITTNTLNNNKVKVTNLTFTKVTSHPGRDSVIINLSLEYNQPTLPQKISRSFTLGVAKASAAIFDTSLQSGTSTPSQLDIGAAGNRWRHLFLAGNLDVNGTVKLGNNSDIVAFMKQGSISVDPPSIGSNGTATANVTLTGIVPGDRIFLTPPGTIENGLVYVGATTTIANTVGVRIRNLNAVATDGAALNWYYLLLR